MILATRETGYYAIKLACDTCGQPIEKADDAMVVWDPGTGDEPMVKKAVCRLVHCGVCDDKKRYQYSAGLGVAFVYWMNNLQLDLKDAKKDAKLLSKA